MQLKYRGLTYSKTQTMVAIDTGVSATYQRLEFPTTTLKYRGVTYQSQPQNIEMVSTGKLAKYRGVTYQIHRPTHIHVLKPVASCDRTFSRPA